MSRTLRFGFVSRSKEDADTPQQPTYETYAGRVRLLLGTFPTAVEHASGLWIKRDDRSGALYGGNKVRKLELLLGEAIHAGKSRVVTIGAAGSHQVVATALYGRHEGLEVEAVLVPQPGTEHARANLRVALAEGLRPFVASSWAIAPVLLASRLGRDAFVIPLGGSSAVGSIGYVEAAKELAAQVAAFELPEPDVVVVAMGSGGTAAGLAVGFELLGMRTRVVGVAVSSPASVLGAMARRMARKTAARIRMPRAAALRAAERISVDARWIGRGYGYATREGERAMEAYPSMHLDPTYTAKALAAAMDLARASSARVLFWHTFSSRPMRGAPGPLTPELERLFTDC